MKKLFFLLIFPILSIGQENFNCSSTLPPNFYSETGYTYRTTALTSQDDRYVFNIKCHYVLGDLPTAQNQYNITEEKILQIIAHLNVNFNQHNIFFKYRGTNILYDSDFTDINTIPGYTVGLKNKFITEGLYEENMLNLFVVQGANQGNIPNDVYLGASAINSPYILSTAIHEFGHLFNLWHVDPVSGVDLTDNLATCIANAPNVWERKMSNLNIPIGGSPSVIENVTRDPLNPKYNAENAGDRVIDTDAAFYGFYQNFCKDAEENFDTYIEDSRVVDNSGDVNTSCYYCFATSTKYSYTNGNTFYTTLNNGITSNINLNGASWQSITTSILATCTQIGSGETYKNLVEERHNPMTRHRGNVDPFDIYFTPGQVNRMRETINNSSYTNAFQSKLNLLDDGSPDISVLYEPFAMGGGSGSSGIPTTAYSKTYSVNTSNTGANVWNCGPFMMRFQPGFDCEFYPYNASTITQTPYQQFNHSTTTSIGVKIPILGQQIYQNFAPVCFYSFEPFTSGDVKSLTTLGSGIYTQEQLDEIKASDPKLYEELQSGKYHIITKQTDSGFIDQKIIYKN